MNIVQEEILTRWNMLSPFQRVGLIAYTIGFTLGFYAGYDLAKERQCKSSCS